MAIKMAVCAYCGVYTETEPEHVVPRCFAPDALRDSCKWVIVRGCSRCNRRFSSDESDFRAFCVMANSTQEDRTRDELFHGPVTRNWRRSDGRGRGSLRRMRANIYTPDGGQGQARLVPDERTLRVVRKIIRGLYYHHMTPKRCLHQVLPEESIWVGPVFEEARQEMDAALEWHEIHPSVFRYGLVECGEGAPDFLGIDSLWKIDAFRGTKFAAIVVSNTFPLVGRLEGSR